MPERKTAAQSEGESPQPQPQPLPCPRCESTNTKFCYYNNYNLSQPRHFCKACRRYWTHGGTLRNIPVGGATRKHAKRCRTTTKDFPAPAPVSSAPPPPPPQPQPQPQSFTSLLSGDGGLGWGWGLGCGFGFGSGYGEGEMGAAPTNGMWGPLLMGEVGGGGGGGDAWQIGIGGGGEVENHEEQCFGWPELAISTSGKCAK
ncbi:hypothetical protein Scep_020475 [Stephania cephalantha]|uniref:Dof zinc finger protein n=1 Tax=Stephania cephalantha TaxID=152367 RepID=A0AAP0ICP5_9MAGN